MAYVTVRIGQCIRFACGLMILTLVLGALPMRVLAAPYADMVIDARTGEVLHQTNADTRLHPASLTKMMTLYIAFEAIEHGEISLDTMVTVSKYAAAQPPSRVGLRAGQKIALRYLIRAAAIKSANDAASAIGDAIEGDRAGFAKRMNRTAKALGMSKTTFKNANGLTAEGHMSTARDMTTLGRRLFYDFPQYYSIFSRRTADAGIAKVSSTNRRFLDSYEGADGIKTGYTAPAGFNLVASAQRGNKRIIAAIFGGTSTANRNARMAELLDLGFGKAPNKAAVKQPPDIDYMAHADEPPLEEDLLAEAVASDVNTAIPAAGKTLRVQGAVTESPRPRTRSSARPTPTVAMAAIDPALMPTTAPAVADPASTEQAADQIIASDAEEMADATDDLMAAMQDTITAALTEAQETPDPEADGFAQTTAPQPETLVASTDPAQSEPTDAPEAEVAVTASAIAPKTTPRPPSRPTALAAAKVGTEAVVTEMASAPAAPAAEPPDTSQEQPDLIAALSSEDLLQSAEPNLTAVDPTAAALAASIILTPAPKAETRPEAQEIMLAAAATVQAEPEPQEVVTRVSTSGGREWGINVGSFSSRYNAERQLLRTALVEMSTLNDALRKVSSRKGAFDANFVGMTEETAALACRRLTARGSECTVVGP